MTYAYGLHGAPAVGGGLPGLPQRQAGGSGITAGGVIPVDAQFGYADEQPANAVEVGAIVEREDYPALSELIPHTFEQTCQLPVVAIPSYGAAVTPVVALNSDGSRMAVFSSGTPVFGNVWSRTGGAFSLMYTAAAGQSQAMGAAAFSPDSQYLYVGLNSTSIQSITPLKYGSGTYAPLAGFGGTSWPVKLLAVSPDGTLLAAASSTTQSSVERVKLWRRSGDTFTAVTLSVTTSATIYGLEFSKDGKYLYATHDGSPYFRVFDVSAATPTEATTGLSFAGYSVPGLFIKVLSDDDIVFTRAGASGSGNTMGFIKRSGPLFSFGPVPVLQRPISHSNMLDNAYNRIFEVDGGSRILVFTHHLISSGEPRVRSFTRRGDQITEDGVVGENDFPQIPGHVVYFSVSEDSKFMAMGIYTSPWLAVYGSESKMVARLNERSPTGQKLYIKG